MISTRSIVIDIEEVPVTWIYEHYCNLTERLTGQDVKIKSVLNARDNDPSFFIYYKDGRYKWKDFSTGSGGNEIQLIIDLHKLSFTESVRKIVKDYSEFLVKTKNGYALPVFREQDRYELGSVKTRNWNNLDAVYWSQYGIGSEILERFNVKPIEEYTFISTNRDKNNLVIRGNYMYGYYTSSNKPYKIYRPKAIDYKFIKVQDYIQGTDQLYFTKPYLVICSSLKDAMCLYAFGYNIEVVAPDSENSIIRPEVINLYKQKYKGICTLMDNDTAGLKAMERYQQLYDIPYLHLKVEKDLSDAVKTHGIERVEEILTPMLRVLLKR